MSYVVNPELPSFFGQEYHLEGKYTVVHMCKTPPPQKKEKAPQSSQNTTICIWNTQNIQITPKIFETPQKIRNTPKDSKQQKIRNTAKCSFN
jgi:hypothetical protein